MSLFGRFIMMWGLIWLYFFLSTAISHANKKQSFTGWLRKVYIPEQDVREEVYEMPISPSKNCPPKLYHLVEKYFRPHQKGITVDMINDAFYSEDNVMRQRGVIIIQVINGSIYVDKSMMPFMEFYEKSRLEFLLERVDEFIRKDHKSLVYPNDFEFVFDPKDCHCYWTWQRGAIRLRDEKGEAALKNYVKLPIFTITKCNGRDTIPIPQWHEGREGPFDKWDENRIALRKRVEQSPYLMRIKGVFREYSSYSIDMQEKPTIITEETRFELGRGRLLSLGWTRPDIFDIAVKVEKNHRHLFEGFLHRLPTSYWMSTLEQAVTYRHVIYSEGWCGWADRLKTLLIFNSTIFLQQTPCHEYYQDLLKPFVHYVPVDGIFRNLPERVEWARSNPASSAKIADNASRMADKYLSSYSIKCYINLVLERYISLCKYKPRRRPMSEPWRPVLLEKTEL